MLFKLKKASFSTCAQNMLKHAVCHWNVEIRVFKYILDAFPLNPDALSDVTKHIRNMCKGHRGSKGWAGGQAKEGTKQLTNVNRFAKRSLSISRHQLSLVYRPYILDS